MGSFLTMKRIFNVLMCLVAVLSINAQQDVTKFLGIPVDGSKSKMIQKLKAKGFKPSSYDKETLTGQFNGSEVELSLVCNNDKVCRIVVYDTTYLGERDIQIRFNTLCQQFKNKTNYIGLGDYTIPDNEDISYEMLVHNKRYEAIFFQIGESTDETKMKPVWFIIAERFGRYIIVMYYDNEYNRANGSDL